MKWNPFAKKSAPAEVRSEPTFRVKPRLSARNYEGAAIGRLTESFIGTTASADADIYRSLPRLRARSRGLFNNNSFAKRYGRMVITNVVGPSGFKFQVKGVRADGSLAEGVYNAAVESGFRKWCKRGRCEITHKQAFTGLKAQMVLGLARDGECLVRKLFGGAAENEFGFALQMLDIDRLDLNYNRDLGGGALIKMGVELNAAGRPVAYHLLRRHPGENSFMAANGKLYERVPADEIYHLFIPDGRPEQTRGVPWIHAAMINMNNLAKFDEAAIINARVGASKMGFFIQPIDADASPVVDAEETDESGEATEFYTESEAGQFGVLPTGYDFKSFEPDFPHANYDSFTKAAVRGLSVGLNVSYPMLSNDLAGVNFSSIRTGVLADRDEWMMIQNFMIDGFLENLGETWLQWALLYGQIKPEGKPPLDSSWLAVFRGRLSWLGRRWAWVDPLKDQKANSNAIADKTKSRTQIAAQNGDDLEEIFADHQRERELAEKFGIDLPGVSVQELSPSEESDEPEDEPTPAPPAKDEQD